MGRWLNSLGILKGAINASRTGRYITVLYIHSIYIYIYSTVFVNIYADGVCGIRDSFAIIVICCERAFNLMLHTREHVNGNRSNSSSRFGHLAWTTESPLPPSPTPSSFAYTSASYSAASFNSSSFSPSFSHVRFNVCLADNFWLSLSFRCAAYADNGK